MEKGCILAALYGDIECIISEQPSYSMHMLGNFDKDGGLNMPVLWGRKDTYISIYIIYIPVYNFNLCLENW